MFNYKDVVEITSSDIFMIKTPSIIVVTIWQQTNTVYNLITLNYLQLTLIIVIIKYLKNKHA